MADAEIFSGRNVIAAILKRLAHRNANVQLYTLTLAESLSKNCGLTLHRELASKAFTAGLEKLVMDRVRFPHYHALIPSSHRSQRRLIVSRFLDHP